MKVFVTGGSGFLGRHLISRLVANRCEVFALARSSSSEKKVVDLGASPIRGDINNVNSFRSALKGMDVVVHCAAPVQFWGDWSIYQNGVIDASLNLANAAITQEVSRFIFISSESVMQDSLDLLDVNEDFDCPKVPNSYYGWSKKITEDSLLSLKSSMGIIILRPSFIWGPECPAFEKIGNKVRTGGFVWVDKGDIAFESVHVENICHAILLALSKGESGRVYLITDGEATNVKEFFSSLFTAMSIEKKIFSVSGWLLKPLAAFTEMVWKGLNLRSYPPLTKFDLSFISMPRRYRIEKAITELGYKPIKRRSQGFEELREFFTTKV